jgi:hypothetical protein
MLRVPAPLAASLLFVLMSSVFPKYRTFTGEIMDSQCGEMGSHEITVNPIETARNCTIHCVRLGGKYVLYDASMRMPYGLDDQRKPEVFAGEKVRVIGTLDNATHTIHVIQIFADGGPYETFARN